MGILVWVSLPTSQMPCGKWDVENSQSPLPFTSQVRCGKISRPNILDWEVGSPKVGSGTQTRIPIFKISASELRGMVHTAWLGVLAPSGIGGFIGDSVIISWSREIRNPAPSRGYGRCWKALTIVRWERDFTQLAVDWARNLSSHDLSHGQSRNDPIFTAMFKFRRHIQCAIKVLFFLLWAGDGHLQRARTINYLIEYRFRVEKYTNVCISYSLHITEHNTL